MRSAPRPTRVSALRAPASLALLCLALTGQALRHTLGLGLLARGPGAPPLALAIELAGLIGATEALFLAGPALRPGAGRPRVPLLARLELLHGLLIGLALLVPGEPPTLAPALGLLLSLGALPAALPRAASSRPAPPRLSRWAWTGRAAAPSPGLHLPGWSRR